jgi:hypothetical protein
MRRLSLFAAVLLASVPAASWAQDGDAPMSPAFLRAMEPMIARVAATSRVVETRHTARIAGRTIRYKAIVSELPLPGADGAPAAVGVS